MKPPSTDTQRMVFGFSLLLILAILALFIALGKVEERTSYGLIPLLTTLSTLARSTPKANHPASPSLRNPTQKPSRSRYLLTGNEICGIYANSAYILQIKTQQEI